MLNAGEGGFPFKLYGEHRLNKEGSGLRYHRELQRFELVEGGDYNSASREVHQMLRAKQSKAWGDATKQVNETATNWFDKNPYNKKK